MSPHWPWVEIIKEVIQKELPEHVRFEGIDFIFDRKLIFEDAKREGYTIERNKVNLGGDDKQCVWESNFIRFYTRQMFKGKPTNYFILNRGGDRPAAYSTYCIGWYKNNEYHRDDNRPAYMSWCDVTWNVNGKWHRTDDGHTVVNAYSGIKFHRNHDLWKRITERGVEIPKGYENGYMIWVKE